MIAATGSEQIAEHVLPIVQCAELALPIIHGASDGWPNRSLGHLRTDLPDCFTELPFPPSPPPPPNASDPSAAGMCLYPGLSRDPSACLRLTERSTSGGRGGETKRRTGGPPLALLRRARPWRPVAFYIIRWVPCARGLRSNPRVIGT